MFNKYNAFAKIRVRIRALLRLHVQAFLRLHYVFEYDSVY